MAVWSIASKKEVAEWHRLDAEFWRPDYRAVYNQLSKRDDVQVLGKIAKRMRKGIFDIPADEYVQTGVPFLRVSNVKPILLDLSNLAFISEARNEHDTKTCFHRGDVVLNKTGDIGAAVIGLPTCNISQDLVGVEMRDRMKHNTFYLAAFLDSKFGQMQLRRWFQGQVQMHLALSDARKLLVAFPHKEQQKQVEQTVLAAEREGKTAESLYHQAEEMLLGAVSFEKVDLSWSPGYLVNVKDAAKFNRIDAEHFQPKYARLIRHLEKTGKAVKLGDIAPKPHRGVQPRYVEGGDVLAVNSRYVGKQFINIEHCERTDRAFYEANKRAVVRKYDVIMNSTGWGTIGRANCVLHDEPTVVDNHVTIIRPTCNPTYLAVFLNSSLGQLQTNQWLSGSSGQIEIYPADVVRYTVFLPSPGFQQKIADLVTAACEARAKAKKLLEAAKQKIEGLIERK